MHASISTLECRTFEHPDEQLDFAEHGRINVVRMHDGTLGMHAIFAPGWTWAEDEKPLIGNPDACPMPHTGYCLAGEIVIRIVATGEERRIRRGDFFEIPPGHDAYVPGDEACEMILFAAPVVASNSSESTAAGH